MSSLNSSQFADENRLSSGRRLLQRFDIDLPLLLGLLALAGTGLFVLYSAGDQNLELVTRQGIRLLIAFVVMLAIAQLSPDSIEHWSPWLFGIGLDDHIDDHGFIRLILHHYRQLEAVAKVEEARRRRPDHERQPGSQVGLGRARPVASQPRRPRRW